MTPAKFLADIKFKINEYIFPPPRRIFFIFSIRIWRETPACIKILSDIKFSYVEWFKDCSAPPETHISAIRKNFQRSYGGCNRLAAIWINLTAVPALFRCRMHYIKIGKFCKGTLTISGHRSGCLAGATTTMAKTRRCKSPRRLMWTVCRWGYGQGVFRICGARTLSAPGVILITTMIVTN